MVCPRCVEAVEESLQDVGLIVKSVELGAAVIQSNQGVSDEQIAEVLEKRGFVLLAGREEKLIAQVKAAVLELIHYQDDQPPVKNSVYLQEKIGLSYSHLSKLFSSLEGITIEKYIILQKIERVKELITYDELSLTQIAAMMHYSSPQHLSNQFRTITGMSVSDFKRLKDKKRISLDQIG
ncbi:MAG: helix-turn-helix transcriptional regulator [Bacteroidota bacterium]